MIEIKDHTTGKHVYLDKQSLRQLLTSAVCQNIVDRHEIEAKTFGEITSKGKYNGLMETCLMNQLRSWELCENRSAEIDRIENALEMK